MPRIENWSLEIKPQSTYQINGVTLSSESGLVLKIVENGSNWSVVDLNHYIGNKNGQFEAGGKNFTTSAQNIALQGSVLHATLRNDQGGWISASIDLNDLFSNNDGEFLYGGKGYIHTTQSHNLSCSLLKATLTGAESRPRAMEIHLDQLLGNSNGKFVWGLSGFAETANNVALTGAMLKADLEDDTRTYTAAEFNLDDLFGNVNGDLVTSNTNFSMSAYKIRLDGTTLHVLLPDNQKNLKENTVDLNQYLANINGVFVQGTGYTSTARNSRLEGTILTANLQIGTGTSAYSIPARFDLSTKIKVSGDGSIWKAHDVVTVVASTDKATVDKALADFKLFFRDHPDLEIHYGSDDHLDANGQETLFWFGRVDMGIQTDKTWPCFKTYGAEAKAAFFKSVEQAGKKIDQADYSLFEAEAGFEKGYVNISGVDIPSYAGFHATANLINVDYGGAHFNLGVGVDTGYGVKDGSAHFEFLGTGIMIGKTTGIEIFGSTLSIDFSSLFD